MGYALCRRPLNFRRFFFGGGTMRWWGGLVVSATNRTKSQQWILLAFCSALVLVRFVALTRCGGVMDYVLLWTTF